MTCEPGDLPPSRGHVRKRRAGCTEVAEACRRRDERRMTGQVPFAVTVHVHCESMMIHAIYIFQARLPR